MYYNDTKLIIIELWMKIGQSCRIMTMLLQRYENILYRTQISENNFVEPAELFLSYVGKIVG